MKSAFSIIFHYFIYGLSCISLTEKIRVVTSGVFSFFCVLKQCYFEPYFLIDRFVLISRILQNELIIKTIFCWHAFYLFFYFSAWDTYNYVIKCNAYFSFKYIYIKESIYTQKLKYF